MSARRRLAFLLALAFVTGCTTQVRVVHNGEPSPGKQQSLTATHPAWWHENPRSIELVRRNKLEEKIQKRPDLALLTLQECASAGPNLDEIAATADLMIRYGRRIERAQPEGAAGWYLSAAALTYRAITNSGEVSLPRHTNASIIKAFNQATTGVVLLLQRLPGGLLTNHIVRAGEQVFEVQAEAGDFDSNPGCYDYWLAADHWKQTGLRRNYRLDGLGARLVACRTNRQATPFELHQPDEGIFHASTAVMHFEAGSKEPATPAQAVKLLLYNPTSTSTAEWNGQSWPLAADFTTPGAMLLSRTYPLLRTRWTGLVQPDKTPRPQRLYLMYPYSPERIPVIMVHGLRSTPIIWEELTNELMGDPELRRRFQFWHYLYPTGLPFLTSAATFRDELETVRKIVDPDGHDFATHHMVVIGHSMGGLLARTLVTDSADAIWNSTFAIPASELDSNRTEIHELRRMFYFQPKPYVERAVFMAVPHRGSKMADGLLGRFVSSRVNLPGHLHDFVRGLNASIPGLLTPKAAPLFKEGYPNSIRVLSPTTPGLVALAGLPVAAGVPFHSILGDRGLGGGERSSDGVVKYSSAHLAGASSELIVPANHRTYENLEAIAEVKRILKLHLAEIAKIRDSVQAVRSNVSMVE